MITQLDAERLDYLLREQGRPWVPASGDRFVIPGRDLDQVFVLAELTIEVDDLPTGRHIRFNGTTEWALDSIEAAEVLWVPWEHQLRDLLGDAFVRLEREGGPVGQYVVTLAAGGRHTGPTPEHAYCAALLGD